MFFSSIFFIQSSDIVLMLTIFIQAVGQLLGKRESRREELDTKPHHSSVTIKPETFKTSNYN